MISRFQGYNPGDGYEDIRDDEGRLLARVDGRRALMSIKRSGKDTVLVTVDLKKYGLLPAREVDKPDL